MRALAPAEVVTRESVVGLHTFQGLDAPPAVDVPTKRWILTGTGLVVAPPAGHLVDDPGVRTDAVAELGDLLGGQLATVRPDDVALYDSLVSDETRSMYEGGGMSISWDVPRSAFSWLAVALDGWRVQALGEPHDFHSVSALRELPDEEDTTDLDDPPYRPLGPLPDLLPQFAPALTDTRWTDRSAGFHPNLFDTVLDHGDVRARSGVRRALIGDDLDAAAAAPLVYVVRIDLRPEQS
jgi:hypothetical protein